jgi:uncharacterized protein (DUF362 family)
VADPVSDRSYTRREILQATAAVCATAAASAFLFDRDTGASGGAARLVKMRDHRMTGAAGRARMAIARGPNPGEKARRAVEAIGGMERFVRRGERVVIKPNASWNRLPEQAANTHPEVVAAVVAMVKAAGASRIWVADVPVNNAERCFARSGIGLAARQAGAEVVFPDTADFRDVFVGGMTLHTAKVFYPFVDADRVINVPVAKHHGLTLATMAMKNWYGMLGGHRALLHQDIHRSIVDLATLARSTLTVLDGTRVLMGNGPSGGSLQDVRVENAVAASTDEVAIDAFGATLLGRRPDEIEFIRLAESRGLGTADYRSLGPVELGS